MHAQLDPMASIGSIGEPADGGYGLLAGGVKQHPATAAALIEEILDASIEKLPEVGRAGGLFEMP